MHWPEWEMLQKESAKFLAHFILHNIIYCWGTLLEIVTDNGTPFVEPAIRTWLNLMGILAV